MDSNQEKLKIVKPFVDNTWEKLNLTQADKLKKVNKAFCLNVMHDVFAEYCRIAKRCGMRSKTMDISKMDLGRFAEYIFHYHYFHVSHLDHKQREDIKADNDYLKKLINDVAWSIYLDEESQMSILSDASSKSPEVVSFTNFYNRLLGTHTKLKIKYDEYDEKISVLGGLLQVAIFTAKGVANLIGEGNTISAIALWRNLFEIECTMAILAKQSESVVKKYLEHQKFANYEEDDSIKKIVKDEANKHKVRNYEYIQYGWLVYCDEFDLKKDFKLSFKRGVLKLAKCEDEYKAYSEASKIIHSSSIIITAPIENLYYFSLVQLFNSTKHIVRIFDNFIKENDLLEEKDFQDYEYWTKLFNKMISDTYDVLEKKIGKQKQS